MSLWRIQKLSDFTGRLEQVWKYLEEQRPDYNTGILMNLKALPEANSDFGRECREYAMRISTDEYAHTPEGDKLEREHVERMNKKYPNAKLVCVRKGNIKGGTP